MEGYHSPHSLHKIGIGLLCPQALKNFVPDVLAQTTQVEGKQNQNTYCTEFSELTISHLADFAMNVLLLRMFFEMFHPCLGTMHDYLNKCI